MLLPSALVGAHVHAVTCRCACGRESMRARVCTRAYVRPRGCERDKLWSRSVLSSFVRSMRQPFTSGGGVAYTTSGCFDGGTHRPPAACSFLPQARRGRRQSHSPSAATCGCLGTAAAVCGWMDVKRAMHSCARACVSACAYACARVCVCMFAGPLRVCTHVSTAHARHVCRSWSRDGDSASTAVIGLSSSSSAASMRPSATASLNALCSLRAHAMHVAHTVHHRCA
jgi:hypothetical protein